MNRLPPLAYHLGLFSIGLIYATIISNWSNDIAKSIGFAIPVWAIGALVNRFGNRTAGLVAAVFFASMAYIGS